MQNKLDISKKSKSVENLFSIQGMSQRKAILSQMTSKINQGRDKSLKDIS